MRLTFLTAIDKFQKQTFDKVGLFLTCKEMVFLHFHDAKSEQKSGLNKN